MRLCDGISALFLKVCHVLYPPRYPGARSRTRSVSGNVLAFGIRITEASQTMPLPRGAVDFARLDFRLVLQDWGQSWALALTLTLCCPETPRQLRLASSWIQSGVCNTLLVSWPEFKFVFTPHSNYWMWNYFVWLSQSAIIYFFSFLFYNGTDEKHWMLYAFGSCWFIFYSSVKLLLFFFFLLPSDAFPVLSFLSFRPCLPIFLSPSRICYNYLRTQRPPQCSNNYQALRWRQIYRPPSVA